MNVLKTFKSQSRSHNLPHLFKQASPQHHHHTQVPRTNLTNLSQTIIRPIRPPSYHNGGAGFSSSRSTITRSALIKRRLRSNLLLFFTIIGCISGVALGTYARSLSLRPVEKAYFGFPGELFLRMLKFAIVPLIASSLVCGIASLGQSKMTTRVFRRAFVYYFLTTFLAVVLGLILVIVVKPGYRVNIETSPAPVLVGRKISPLDTVLDLLRNLFPDNIVQMTFMQYESRMVPKYKPYTSTTPPTTTRPPINQLLTNFTTTAVNITANETIYQYTNSSDQRNNLTNISTTAEPLIAESGYRPKEVDYWIAQPGERYGINVLGLVMFCFVLGYVLPQMKRRGRLLIELCEAVNQAAVRIVEIIMLLSPIGICSLICHAVLTMDDPKIVFEKISYYLGTVFVGLMIHGLIVLPLLYVIITRKNVFVFAQNMFEALLVAFATSSSNASLPITQKCVEEKNRIPRAISRFVLPVGATINMDGTALYEAVAAIFIAQLNNIDLKMADYIVASLTATVASIGAAGIPSSGLVTMIVVLSALNLPQTQISLIYAVDWFLDRFRTTINVWGDAIGTGIVAHLSRVDLLAHREKTAPEFDTETEKKPMPDVIDDVGSSNETHLEAENENDDEEDVEEEEEDDDDDEKTMPEEFDDELKQKKEADNKSLDKNKDIGIPATHKEDTNDSNCKIYQYKPSESQVIQINEGFQGDEVQKNNETTF